MIRDEITYCNVCGAEIPDGEPTNEFTTGLLAATGHCHTECLAQRNAVLGQFEESFRVLASLLNPEQPSAPKARQAAHVEARRARSLKRVHEAARPVEKRTTKPRKKAAKKPAKKRTKKVKRA